MSKLFSFRTRDNDVTVLDIVLYGTRQVSLESDVRHWDSLGGVFRSDPCITDPGLLAGCLV